MILAAPTTFLFFLSLSFACILQVLLSFLLLNLDPAHIETQNTKHLFFAPPAADADAGPQAACGRARAGRPLLFIN